MFKIKLLSIVLLLTAVLSLGSPAVKYTKANNVNEQVPYTVLVQDVNNKMLVHHNFEFDNGLMIPWSQNTDDGIFVDVSSAN